MTLDDTIKGLRERLGERESFCPSPVLLEAIAGLTELAEYRKTGLTAADIQEAVNLLDDTLHPDDLPAELKSWVERCTWHVKQCAKLHEEAAALIEKNADLLNEITAAKRDIAAILWLDGHCQYCAHSQKECYSGANRWTCKLGGAAACRPEWRGRCPE